MGRGLTKCRSLSVDYIVRCVTRGTNVGPEHDESKLNSRSVLSWAELDWDWLSGEWIRNRLGCGSRLGLVWGELEWIRNGLG